ncbi:sensor histidine kinase [Acidithiobacillus thiooxidans]|uniref:histidine kinase n=1 Tax=Acidithiobacillus thiooxidans ATCC 19377 TaxID=637390 RepID=A0A543Q1B1_ACITH|nr:HAMP domain-containing sensor histidine kinase [Acidithiobacillus thiooxidans]MDX5933179.1 HAMP domain-containing sensor histidine kinase [Acidithiobacillus thiooxidans]TQN50108.1 Sensor histidine kinase YclK [Acidithiobacillus thiooxidans ATCC 19377]
MAADFMEEQNTGQKIMDSPAKDHHGAISIPRRVLFFAIIILFLVAGVVFAAIQAIHTLGDSSNTLIEIGLPLQKQLLEIHGQQRQAEFYQDLAQVLPHSGYEATFAHLIHHEQTSLQTLQTGATAYPQLANALQQLQVSLNNYLHSATKTPGSGQAAVLDGKASRMAVEARFHDVHQAMQSLLLSQGEAAAAARSQAVQLLYALVVITALLSLLIPWRVATALTRPLKDFRLALEDIGAGKVAHVANDGPQELRDLARSIDSMQARLREEERLRHQFLSQVSHELKTPLASARSGSELLLSERIGPLLPRQREVLEIVVRQVKELYAAIQEMLDMHALQAQSLDFSPQTVKVSEILEDLQKRMQPLTEKKQQTLICESHAPLEVYADPQRLRQILSNLVSNANKYSSGGGQIRVQAIAEQQGVLFRVEDEGPGIPEALLERVFERFYQVPVSNSLPRGTGLGLAITRELVAAQDGWIRIQNRPQGGLSAEIWLPSSPQKAAH